MPKRLTLKWKRKGLPKGQGRGTLTYSKGTRQLWVYGEKTWKIDPKTGNIKKGSHKIIKNGWTIRDYTHGNRTLAKPLKGKKFRTKSEASGFLRKFVGDPMKKRR